MGQHRRWVQLTIFTCVLLLGVWTLWSSLYASEEKPVEGSKAPDFTLVGSDGRQHKLSDYKGKTVMVNFWGTWCPPCKQEMPAIQSQFEKHNPDNVAFLGVNIGESPITVQNFMQQHKLTFPILFDDNQETRQRYGVMNYPTTFFIDAEGNIARIWVGEMNEDFIEQTIASISGTN
ncbi:redoxin domain-containing protein [Paenibacillus xerothermodurans]|uniref:Thiol-disulfide oxidoreductase n=1 Tax=Paenibacillus xerothermodurans TaxID=1977292 RepID=A0A2W1P2N1_PAEXE|nr:redoxin domain-containing protein [Paenibacillus xerothermodurans]PZE21982.1 thiol-disulfide oxidoreductase [Paenibacillus xerothermodurans]